jgi:Ca-activated chloride channel family protein
MRRTLARVLLASCLGLAACQSTSAVKADQAAPDVALGTGSADEETAEVAAAVPAEPMAAPNAEQKAEPTPVTVAAPSAAPPPPAPSRRPMPVDPASSALDLGGDDPSANLESVRGQAGPAAVPARTRTGTAAAYGRGAGVVGGYSHGRVMVSDTTSSEAYKDYGTNAWVDSTKDALSTFAVDVDTASYTIARRKLTEGALPPKAAVRVEEFVNYFGYRYPRPDGARPFSVTADLAPSPFTAGRHILRVGVATRPLAVSERKPANLVFLVDVSGSMQSPDKLLLAKRALRILVDNLKDGDTVSLVTYAGSTRVVLAPTGLARKDQILSAIEELSAGGSTAMASGLELAYQQAAKGLRPGAISRVIVLSDGDANVGNTSHADMLKTIAGHVKEGVTLSTVGFGMGNYKDETMEQLANKGNGNNYYIDGISQARRVFQEQLGGTLEVVAKDVKIQVELDPAQVARYRLVGYENRDVADVDFRNDKVDAGEIGAGHQVTAVYEVELAAKRTAGALATVRVRHKEPRGEKAMEAAFPVLPAAVAPTFAAASDDLRFATAVAAFADVLRGSEDAEHWSLAEVRRIAAAAAGADRDRRELVALIDRAIALSGGGSTAAIAR